VVQGDSLERGTMRIFNLITMGIFMCCMAGCSSVCNCSNNQQGIIAAGATLQTVSTEFKFTEGPAADKDGNVYFTDQPNDRIMRYTADGKMEIFMQPCGRSNGLYIDADGKLIACADEKSELWRIDIKTKQHEVLVKDFDGKLLNGPNDAWVHPAGWIYFTDPFYKRSYWSPARDAMEQSCQGVYRFDPDTQKVIRLVDDLKQPNGIIGTPDGKKLYVADIKGKKIYVYDIGPDGALSDKKLFCKPGSDGMTIDCCGNVYLTGDGVLVFNSDGKQIEHIKVPQRWTANVTFGGKDRKTLFITASTGFYSLKMNVCGVK
jgi:gluconolactonase